MSASAVAARPRGERLRGFVALPWRDLVAAIESIAAGMPRRAEGEYSTGRGERAPATAWLALAAVFVVTWFVYVPVHELLHAYGCIAAGGDVTRLEVSPEYGGALLARVFPFVVAGSEYAGQLTGFDTHGSDAVYLATVLAPYVLTIFPGVMLLERRTRIRASPALRAAAIGVALPLAFAPFLSLAGDYYEAGSIVATRFAHAGGWLPDPAPLRSDDVFKLAARLGADHAGVFEWALVAASFAVGSLLAFLTYHLGALVARLSRSTTEIPQ
jgi:hypothetical protein